MSIAVVRGDSVIFAKGYGVRRLGDPAPVDARTIFAIGSNSKAFTAAGLAMPTTNRSTPMRSSWCPSGRSSRATPSP
jgi:hypothetical protein